MRVQFNGAAKLKSALPESAVRQYAQGITDRSCHTVEFFLVDGSTVSVVRATVQRINMKGLVLNTTVLSKKNTNLKKAAKLVRDTDAETLIFKPKEDKVLGCDFLEHYLKPKSDKGKSTNASADVVSSKKGDAAEGSPEPPEEETTNANDTVASSAKEEEGEGAEDGKGKSND